MYRLFFGQMYSCSAASSWLNAFDYDHKFPMFLEGTVNNHSSTDYFVHDRVPQYVILNPAIAWDEYIDLYRAETDVESNEMTFTFKDIAGVNEYIQFPSYELTQGSQLSGNIINKIILETDSQEFLVTTKFINMPVPDTTKTKTPRLYGENRTLSTDPNLAVNGYVSFSVTVHATSPSLNESYASRECYIPYNNKNTDDIFLALYNETGYTTASATLFRADISKRMEDDVAVFRHDDMMLQINHSFTGMHGQGWNSLTASPYTNNYANETTFPYSSKSISTFCPFEPTNKAFKRVGLDFFNRNRPVNKVYWLLLNTKTHKYYKCIILNVSNLFIEGFDASSSDRNVKLSLGVVEEGTFVDDALEDPNTSSYFSSITRGYTNV